MAHYYCPACKQTIDRNKNTGPSKQSYCSTTGNDVILIRVKTRKNRKQMKNKVEIKWTSRYSETMEDDDMGRWARVAYAGKLDGMGFHYNKVARFEIAWISKIKEGRLNEMAKNKKFIVTYKFPNNKGGDLFETLAEAKKETEKQFRWFIKMVTLQKQTL